MRHFPSLRMIRLQECWIHDNRLLLLLRVDVGEALLLLLEHLRVREVLCSTACTAVLPSRTSSTRNSYVACPLPHAGARHSSDTASPACDTRRATRRLIGLCFVIDMFSARPRPRPSQPNPRSSATQRYVACAFIFIAQCGRRMNHQCRGPPGHEVARHFRAGKGHCGARTRSGCNRGCRRLGEEGGQRTCTCVAKTLEVVLQLQNGRGLGPSLKGRKRGEDALGCGASS